MFPNNDRQAILLEAKELAFQYVNPNYSKEDTVRYVVERNDYVLTINVFDELRFWADRTADDFMMEVRNGLSKPSATEISFMKKIYNNLRK